MSVLRKARGERRQRDRQPANGPITLWWMECKQCKIEGRLVDASDSGFRVAHDFAGLGPGQHVHFEHARGKGIACTVWTRIVADTVESGFHILSK